jgi:hypothetical protein
VTVSVCVCAVGSDVLRYRVIFARPQGA